jgi:hypothetical protein
MHRYLALPLALALLSTAGCPGGHGDALEPGAASHAEDHYVRNIDLSTTRGEVGRPFESAITWEDNYLTEIELTATGLPPGLSLNPPKRIIAGTPTRAGFFTVEVAVRKKFERDEFHKTQPDERWWPARLQIEIYAPLAE